MGESDGTRAVQNTAAPPQNYYSPLTWHQDSHTCIFQLTNVKKLTIFIPFCFYIFIYSEKRWNLQLYLHTTPYNPTPRNMRWLERKIKMRGGFSSVPFEFLLSFDSSHPPTDVSSLPNVWLLYGTFPYGCCWILFEFMFCLNGFILLLFLKPFVMIIKHYIKPMT